MKTIVAVGFCLSFVVSNVAWADTFGTGANQFAIEFVTISGDASGANGTYIGDDKPEGFREPGYDYRIAVHEITNDQWNKFQAELDPVTVTGNPASAYDLSPYWTDANVPTNNVSWYEAAQFVNWLNTSTGHQPAYKFTGTQGTAGYSLDVWQMGEAGYDPCNPYRNSNAFYCLPTEDEWVKAAYWNGTTLQTWATPGDTVPVPGVDTNYYVTDPNYTVLGQPWDVGSGSAEINGTFDMMGNVWEWMESPYFTGDYLADSYRGLRGSSYGDTSDFGLWSSARWSDDDPPSEEERVIGFRVASVWDSGTGVPVYRFWSDSLGHHFYTISEAERDKLIDQYAGTWTYEGPAYHAFATASETGLVPVYRFWSDVLSGHFYTINESEKDKLVTTYSHVWTYEGPAFYAYPDGQQPGGTSPVYRFWSDALKGHFYTIRESEKDKLVTQYPDTWAYEGIAWYAYE